MVDPALTKDELVSLLDAKIRRSAGYKLRDNGYSTGSLGIQVVDDEALKKVAAAVHDDIVTDFAYSENIVKAVRAVKAFGVVYVLKVIKAGLKDGAVQLETAVAEKVKDAVAKTEVMPPWLKKKVNGDDKEKGKGKKNPFIKKKGPSVKK